MEQNEPSIYDLCCRMFNPKYQIKKGESNVSRKEDNETSLHRN